MFRYNLQVVFAQIITWMTFAGVRYWKLTHGLEHQGKMGCGETGLSEVMPQAMFLFVQPGIDIFGSYIAFSLVFSKVSSFR